LLLAGRPAEAGTRASSSRRRLTGARPVPVKTCSDRESKRNCVAARRGGEQRNERMQTLTKVNPIRPPCGPSLRVTERRQARCRRDTRSAHPTSRHCRGRMEVGGDGMRSKTTAITMRELAGKAAPRPTNPGAGATGSPTPKPNRTSTRPPVVRVPIVAMKPGNSGGVKGGRKMNGGQP